MVEPGYEYGSGALVAASELAGWARGVHDSGRKIVFTNGCYDLLHPGHLSLLQDAAASGDVLIVAINADESVVRLKGPDRPILPQSDRAEILLGLRWVDVVTVFVEDTPMETIELVRPDVLVKGAEYGQGEIVGEEFVKSYGGTVKRFPMKKGYGTSNVIERIRSAGTPPGE